MWTASHAEWLVTYIETIAKILVEVDIASEFDIETLSFKMEQLSLQTANLEKQLTL